MAEHMKFTDCIEYSLLKQGITGTDIMKCCREISEYGFYSVCVTPFHVPLCVKLLKPGKTKIYAVVGHPFGETFPLVKAVETKLAVLAGADGIDMTANTRMIREGDWEEYRKDIGAVMSQSAGKPVGIILESCLLTDAEKIKATEEAVRMGVSRIKTSSGFSYWGPTEGDVKTICKSSGGNVETVASGEIRTLSDAARMLSAGAVRISTQSVPEIMAELKERGY